MHRLASLALLLALAVAPAGAATRAFVFQTDFTTGSLSTIDVAPRRRHCDVSSVNSDAVLRFYNGRLYVVNRFGADNIQVIDPATNATVKQFSVGAGANPYDIAFASPTKAYVTRYEKTDLWIVNPATGAHTGTISLAAFADADGIPEMARLETVGPLLFVALQRVDRAHGFVATDTSLVAVVDMRTDTVVDCDPTLPGVQAIHLQLTDPVTTFQFDHASSRLLIGCVGHYGVADAGCEWIDPVGLKSAGVAISEAALHGDVNAISLAPGNVGAAHAFAIVSDAAFNTLLVRFDAEHGTLLDTLYAPGGYSLSDLAETEEGELWVCDSGSGSPGVRVFSAASGAPIAGPLACTLPPYDVVFDAANGQVGAVEPTRSTLSLSLPWPSPARSGVRFALSLASAGAARLEAFDAGGRRVRTLFAGERPAGPGAVVWDLADDRGRRVPPGLYLVRLQAAGETRVRRLVVLP